MSKTFTRYGWLVCLWVLVLAFQYGYHISVLNQLQDIISCKDPSKRCTGVPMDEPTFSAVTASFTFGGLVGSLAADGLMARYGRHGAARASAACTAAGTLVMVLAGSVGVLGLGRTIVGVGSGIGICVGPVYLAEIAPAGIAGRVGVLTQLSIVIGIMITQLLGLGLATPSTWRIVVLASTALAGAQLALAALIPESPAALRARGSLEERARVVRSLWGDEGATTSREDEGSASDPLLADEAEARRQEGVQSAPAMSARQALWAPELRRPLLVVCFAMASQQVSGINAVLYYSNAILSKTLPDMGPYLSLGITVVNVLMTFPPIILIEKLGRRPLLTMSVVGAVVSLLAVGYGLDSGYAGLASVAILTFVTSFAIGLGPVPFVMIPEVSPFHAVSALSSIGLSLNWIINFFVGLVFLPLRNALAGGRTDREGRVFYVFAVLLAGAAAAMMRAYRK